MVKGKSREGFAGNVCRSCGATFDWGGAERKREHTAWHREVVRNREKRRPVAARA